VEELCDLLQDHYDHLLTNVRLFSKARKPVVLAEIDILARKGRRIDVYEVKCSHRISKARRQLQKICKLLPEVNNTYFFCGESGLLKMINTEIRKP